MMADTLDGPSRESIAVASCSSVTGGRVMVMRTRLSSMSSLETTPSERANWCHRCQRVQCQVDSGTSAGLHQAVMRRRGRSRLWDVSTVRLRLRLMPPAHCSSSSISE